MKCLDNFIGIRQVCQAGQADIPRSGLCIEDLPGITVSNISNITSEVPNAVNLINQKVQFAGKIIHEDILETISPDLVDALVVERGNGGDFSDKNDSSATTDWHVALAGDNGLRIRKVRTTFTNLRIPNIYLLAQNDIPTVNITLSDGVESKTITVTDIVSGIEKKVFVDYVSTTEQVDLKWDTSALTVSNGSTFSTQSTNHCGCSNGTYEFITATGLKGNVETNELYGIRADILVECNTDKMMCLLTQRLKMAILYKTGVLLLEEWEASDRLNFLTIHGKEWAKAKKEEWNELCEKKLESIKPTLKNFLMGFDEFCFKCGGFRYGYVHP